MLIYPRGQLDNTPEILQAFGSFWQSYFSDSDKLLTMFKGNTMLYEQTYLNFLESLNSLSRQKVPTFHRQLWQLLTFKESDVISPASYQGVYSLATTSTHGDGSLAYGQDSMEQLCVLPLPKNLVGVKSIFNRILSPSLVLISGIDFKIDVAANVIVFKENIFRNEYVAKRSVVGTDNQLSDTEVALWGYSADYDKDLLYNNFGFAVGVRYPSSENVKTLINSLWDNHVTGPTLSGLESLLSAAVGIPTVHEATETVQVVIPPGDIYVVVTDKHVYRLPPGSTPTVSIGDKLVIGQQITDTIRIVELSNNNVDYTNIPGVTLSTNFLAGAYFRELHFSNMDVPLEYVGLDSNGKAMVRFQVSGFPADIDQFWTDTHARGVANGITLANALDTRINKVGEPVPANLPSTVNPMQFVFSQLTGSNALAILINYTDTGSNPGLSALKFIPSILPPYVVCFVYVTITLDSEVFDLSTSDTDTPTMVNVIAPESFVYYALDLDNPGGPNDIKYEDMAPFVHGIAGVCGA